MVTKKCQVEFKIGGYRDEILCDLIPMDVCHVLLGRLLALYKFFPAK
jgi:hypothetical protein